MNIIASLLVGLIAGWLADKVYEDRFGLVGDLLVGLLGGFVGGVIFSHIGVETPEVGFIGSIIVAFIGAVLLLGIAKAFTGKRTT